MNWEEAKKREVFSVLTGSRLYGTERPDSDFDIRSVFIADPLYTGPTTIRNPDGSDESTCELREFVRLLVQGDNQKIEMLYAPSNKVYLLDTRHFQPILDTKKTFLSKAWMGKTLGFARSVVSRSPEPWPSKHKDVAHVLRVLTAMHRTNLSGCFDPVVRNAVELEHLTRLKSGLASNQDLETAISMYIKPLEKYLSEVHTLKPLPDVELSRVQTALGTVLTRFWGYHDEPKPSTTAVEPETYESNYDRDTAFLVSYNKQDVGGWS